MNTFLNSQTNENVYLYVALRKDGYMHIVCMFVCPSDKHS